MRPWRTEPAVALGLALAVLGCGESRRGASLDDGVNTGAKPDPRGRAGELLVLDEVGVPMPSVPALVDGAVVYTDADGFATLPELGASYDVAVAPASDPNELRVHVFGGLRSRAPVVELDGERSSSGAAKSVLLDIDKPANLGDDTALTFTIGVDGVAPKDELLLYTNSDSDVSAALGWNATSSTTLSAEAFLLQIDPLTEEPLAYLGYAAGAWSDPAANLTWTPDFAEPSFDGSVLHVEVTHPAGASVTSYDAQAIEGSGRHGSLGFALADPSLSDATSAVAELLVPALPDTLFYVTAVTSADDSTYTYYAESPAGVLPGDDVELAAHAGPAVLAPADGGVVAPDTNFTWTPDDGAIYRVFVFDSDDVGAHFEYVLETAEPHANLPDLSAIGAPFPWGRSFAWEVNTLDGVASLDAYAAGSVDAHGQGYSNEHPAQGAPSPP
ncbi:MAG TPA: hypothetical protein VMI54_00245 [Polyangiaceae bacterium]|nr:hypothetical protein [Polyangiaceae bacterium]